MLKSPSHLIFTSTGLHPLLSDLQNFACEYLHLVMILSGATHPSSFAFALMFFKGR